VSQPPGSKNNFTSKVLQNNTAENTNLDIQLPENIAYTQPYWLKDKGTVEGIPSTTNKT
jgi:hypothetical protein